jgi:uncharacterized protein (DUF2267 family)
MTESNVFEPHVATANKWLDQIAETLEFPAGGRAKALRALRAGLHAIRDRLPAEEVLDLGAQLPLVIKGLYCEGWSLSHKPTDIRTRAAMIARVQKELDPDLGLDPTDVLRATIHLLVEHVTPGEILDVVGTLPKPIAELWRDLTGHAIDTLGETERT